MGAQESVTTWIGQFKAGGQTAAQRLWETYLAELVRLARKRLNGRPRAVADEEDVALSAFNSLWRGVQANRFPQLNDRGDLWQLLVLLTARKAVDLVEREQRQKRGGGKVRHASALAGELVNVVGREPTPAFAAQFSEECGRRLDSLADPQLRAVAVLKMEGYSNEEIAVQLGRALSSIERKLRRIRSLWSKELDLP